MSIRDDFFAAQAKASLWDVAVSIKRGNPLPLDANSVFKAYGTVGGEDYAGSLLEYATSNPVAYPGQICAVVGADATTIYYLDQTLAIQPVGIIPSGDDKTIEVTAAGAISLLGAADAPNGTLPMIDSETGKLIWKTLEDIGAGDGNDNTTYEFSFANEKITIIPKFNGQPIVEGETQVKYELDLSTFVTADELSDAIKDFVSTDTTYSVAEGEKVLKLNDTVFSTELGLKHENGKISLTGIDGAVIAEFSDADFVKDSVLEDVAYNAETQEIEFTWKTIDGTTKTDAVSVADFVQVYTAGTGIKIENNIVSADTTVVATKEDLEDYYTANEVDTEFAKYTNTQELTALLNGKQDTIPANTYDAYGSAANAKSEAIAAAATDATTKANQALADAKADTAEQLKSYYTSAQVDNKFGTVDIELDTKQDKAPEGKTYAYTSDIDTAVDSLKNTEIKNAQDTANAANATANTANAQASENKTAIESINTTIAGHTTKIGENTDAIAVLQQADIDHHALYEALLGTVNTHGTDIAGLKTGKADQSALEAAVSRIAANEQAITTINETTIPAVDNKVEAIKADYLKAADKTELSNAIKAIADDYLKTTDKTELAAAIKAIADDYLKAADKAELVEDIGEVATRVTTAEGEIDTLQETIKGLSGAMHFKGVVASDPTSEDFVTTGYAIGDVVIFGNKEYVFAEVDIVVGDETVKSSKFVEFGDATGNASAISDLNERVETLEEVDHAAAHAATLKDAKDYADGLASDYATAEQGGKADSAVQEVTCATNMGIKATRTGNNILLDWDDTVTLVLCGGDAGVTSET